MSRTRQTTLIVFILVVVAAVTATYATGVLAGDPVPPIKRGILVGTVGPQPPSKPDTPGPRSCGNWSSSTEAVGAMITARYGEIRSCEVFGDQVVVATLGSKAKALPGAIAIYKCAPKDARCLDGRTPHSSIGWQFFPDPHHGSIKIQALWSANELLISDGGGEECFDLNTYVYGKCPPS